MWAQDLLAQCRWLLINISSQVFLVLQKLCMHVDEIVQNNKSVSLTQQDSAQLLLHMQNISIGLRIQKKIKINYHLK